MPITPTNRQWQIAGFLQDTYQATPKLTIDLGLRYEYYSPVVPRYQDGASNFDPYTNTLLVAGYGNVDLATGVGSQSMPEPRVGFAYAWTTGLSFAEATLSAAGRDGLGLPGERYRRSTRSSITSKPEIQATTKWTEHLAVCR